MHRIQRDDREAFAALYDRYSSRSYGFARTLCPTSERADEAVQDAFLRLWRSRATYNPAYGSARTWIFALIRRSCIDSFRRHRRGDALRASDAHLRDVAAPESPEDAAERDHDGRQVRAALRRISVAQREVIVLAYFGGLTHVEIAARLDVPLGTVKGRMRLGMTNVRHELSRS
ncbi:MAG: RNA polymerase sigma factor, partial [Solirubrobacteraceae bacterium]